MQIRTNSLLHGKEPQKQSKPVKIWTQNERIEKNLAVEHQVQIYLNDLPVMQIICSPKEVLELAIGRMLTDGLIPNGEAVDTITIDDKEETVKMVLKASASESGITQKKKLHTFAWQKEDIFQMSEMMNKGLPLYEDTHAVHCAMLSYKGEVLYQCEDIGRHNALDKVIGHAVIDGVNLEECILFSSGRVPADMAKKVIRAGIPVLAAKGLPTADAVELAKAYNLALLVNVKANNMLVCTEQI